MLASLVPKLVCPESGAPLVLHAEETEGEQILGGHLASPNKRYPIMNGVPCFVPPDRQGEAKTGFADMWRMRREGKFESGVVYGIAPERKATWVETRLGAPLTPGTWAMDAGCGSAELTAALAARHPDTEVVGLDLNDTVRAVASGYRDRKNLHFVQADIANPPFAPGSFDRVFSLGVLHHTPDTLSAFRGASRLLAPDGRLLVWLYPAAHESLVLLPLYVIRDVHLLRQGHKLPAPMLYRISQLYALGLLPSMAAGWAFYRLGTRFSSAYKDDQVLDPNLSLKDLFHTTAFGVYDNLTPQYQHRHTRREVLKWFQEHGFEGDTDGHGTYWGRRVSTAGVSA